MTAPPAGHPELAADVAAAGVQLETVNQAREVSLAACRRTIRAAGRSIRAVHRLDTDTARQLLAECEAEVRAAQEAAAPFPALAGAGFLHDAEKEYAEAALLPALIDGSPVADHRALAVGLPAWLNGLAEAASELRRHLLDRLREGRTATAEDLLATMEEVYELLVSVEQPDAVTGGLRRTADALRAVLERTRSDVTATIQQLRLIAALEGAGGASGNSGEGPGPAVR
ncbi:MAG TPA: hypothetical protein VKV25_07455 [Acidimicrobiales bacterium]|nr:hypothetical protein [Acidimicrobiales bacterium]